MDDQEVLELLRKIDGGYEPAEEEIKTLSSVEIVTWRRIKEIPESISFLSGLKELDVHGFLGEKTKLSHLPSSIGCLTSLQSLNLSLTQISELPSEIVKLKSLHNLSMSRTQIKELPSEIGNLTSLEHLNLSYTQISELPPSIGNLTSLQSLDLNRTQIRELPSEIVKLTSLQSLNLLFTQISELPSEIGNLTSLQSLDLIGTQISKLPLSIVNLTSLQRLDLSGTKISELPVSIGNLKSLQSLSLNRAPISELPSSIGNLTSLEFLNLRETQISSVPPGIGNLTSLQGFDLCETKISRLPNSIGNLTNLERLYLSQTQISELPPSIGKLCDLKVILLENCTINELPESLLALNLEYKNESYESRKMQPGIYIQGLKLKKQPVSLFYQPRDLIIDYYRQPKIAVNETKVIFLGSEGVGKTHTIKRILNDNHEINETLKETPGISITYKDFATEDFTYRINFWDFGGQEIMHAMHRCFLTNRTGYVIVVSTRYGDVTAQARVWLRNLRSFAEDAPVIVFVNVWNDGTYYGIDESKLRHEFNNIESIIHCSARDSETRAFAAVTEAIKELAVRNDSVGMHFPKTWENVRQEIIAEGRKHNCIDSEQYKAICNKYNVTDPSIQGWLLDWFNDLGECFTYQSGEEIVSGERYSMILNPEWLTNAVYLIIREMGDTAEKGVAAHKKIKNLLVTSKNGTKPGLIYSEDDCEYILEVMRKHQLSYKIPAKEKEFIPALLKDSSDEITIPKGKDSIRYEMQYDYLPKNVLHNLLVEYYVLVDEEKCWRNRFAVQVEGMGETEMAAVISADYENNVISIQIEQYAERETWESLQAIRNKIFEINEKLNLTAKDFIVVDSKDEDGRAERANLKRLLKLQERGVERYEAYERGFDIYKLLGKAFGEAAVENVKAALQIDKDISIEGLIAELGKQGARDLLSAKIQELVSIENIYEYIMSACMIIQKRMIFWSKPGHDVPEDARNDEMRDLLISRGLTVHDQTHTGYGATGKNPGEVDLMIIKPQGDLQKEMTLVEAMNLSGVRKKYIFTHLEKLVKGYNTSGLRDLYLVSYVELERSKYSSFWKRYKNVVLTLNGEEFIVDNEVAPVINEELGWIKSIKLAYDDVGVKSPQFCCLVHC